MLLLQTHLTVLLLVVVRRNNDKVYVIDGEHRVEAAKVLKLESIPAIDLGEVDDEKARILLINLNRLRGEFSPVKFAKIIEELENKKIDLTTAIYIDEKELDTYRLLKQLDEENIENIRTIIESEEVETEEKVVLKNIDIDGIKNVVIDRENMVVIVGNREIPVENIKKMSIEFTKKLEGIFHLELKYPTQKQGDSNQKQEGDVNE